MALSVPLILFYAFASLSIGAAFAVVMTNNPIRSALFLVLTFFACAGVWLLAQAEFLALILVLVYVGAVMTLFLFVIMMLNLEIPNTQFKMVIGFPLFAILLIFFLGLLFYAISPAHFDMTHLLGQELLAVNESNTEALGQLLYTHYVLAFELAGVLLLVAILAAIALAHRPPRGCRTQDPAKQMRVDPKDCVRIVKMVSEKEPRMPQQGE